MPFGTENDLPDLTFWTGATPVHFVNENVLFQQIKDVLVVVDNKAIFARTTAQTVATDFGNHQGSGGDSEHPDATSSESGFMSATQALKLSKIQEEAQVNAISPLDALELVSRNTTFLHRHANASASRDGFMSLADFSKLATIQAGAQVNNISDANAAALTGGGVTSLHTHPGGGGGSGTVTQVNSGDGLTGGPITAAGTLAVNSSVSRSGHTHVVQAFNSGWVATSGAASQEVSVTISNGAIGVDSLVHLDRKDGAGNITNCHVGMISVPAVLNDGIFYKFVTSGSLKVGIFRQIDNFQTNFSPFTQDSPLTNGITAVRVIIINASSGGA